jgi:hypothetical protein
MKRLLGQLIGILAILMVGHVMGPITGLGQAMALTLPDHQTVSIKNYTGRIDIVPSSGSEIVLTLKNETEKLEEFLTVASHGMTLEIAGKMQTETGSSTVIGSSTVVVIGRGARSEVTIGNKKIIQSEKDLPALLIMMPANKDLKLNGAFGHIEIKVPLKSLDGAIDGASQLNVVATGSATFDLSGAVEVDIRKLDGDLKAELSGACELRISEGRIGDANLDLAGAGSVKIKAETETASIEIAGAGEVEFTRLKNPPDIDMAGAGSVIINGREI